MFASERFLSRIGRFRKTNRSDPVDRQIAMIRGAFVDLNRHLPEGVVEEVLDCFAGDLADGPEESAFDRCRKLADVMDVLHLQYDVDNDPITPREWGEIGAVVSDNADDLDLEFITYVMKLAVDHGAV